MSGTITYNQSIQGLSPVKDYNQAGHEVLHNN